jgi:hypothetical protein
VAAALSSGYPPSDGGHPNAVPRRPKQPVERESEVNREALIRIVEVETEQPDRLHGAGRIEPALRDLRSDAERIQCAVQFVAQLVSMIAIENQHASHRLVSATAAAADSALLKIHR